jgi:hypothetical protein
VSSSGLIYAVIVGAWAAYLVPMWLRRQDELNEARPTERFSTAIRLLSGRAALERRYARERGAEGTEGVAGDDASHLADPSGDPADPGHAGLDGPEAGTDRAASLTRTDADAGAHPVDVRAFAVPATAAHPVKPARAAADDPGQPGDPRERAAERSPDRGPERGADRGTERGHDRPHDAAAARRRAHPPVAAATPRARVLAARRRTITLLFLAFTVGAIAAAVGGVAFLWAPAVPAVLLTLYIGHLRRQERRRFEVKLDQRRAADAARRLRERPPAPRPAAQAQARAQNAAPPAAPRTPAAPPAQAPASAPVPEQPAAADRRALVEQTDHAEWVDQQRAQHTPPPADHWDAPVPNPTYSRSPVTPRRPGARSRTPLFDQQADRPRAANE